MAICFVLREHANVAIPLVIVTNERLLDGDLACLQIAVTI
jgi:hypothetical protein